MTIIYVLIGFLIGIGITAAFLIPKIKNRINFDEETSKANQELKEKNSILETTNIQLYDEKHDIQTAIEAAKAKREEVQYSIDLIKKQNEEYLEIAEEQLNKEKEKIQDNFEKDIEILANNYQNNIEEYQSNYLEVLNDASQEIQEYFSQIQTARNQLENLQSKISSAIKIEKTRQADEIAQQKYKILLSEEDLIEINRLKEVAPFLRNARPVYKIIWEGYYRNPTNDLINRILDNKTITGIYLITNTLNHMSYVGQSTNVSDRLKQHIKCGLGIDTPNNILYQAMKKDGVENFRFQLIEECSREELNDKEKYWIEFYKTNEFGYNMTRGNS